jgi:UDP-N-acetylmuramoylalanine--D-glutamate ligase
MDYLKRMFHGKKVTVVGLGLQGGGAGAVEFLTKLGAKVTVTDLKTKEELQSSIDKLSHLDIKYVLGHHDIQDFVTADMIFKGPSVPWTMPELVEAMHRGIPVEMETAFFAAHCPAKMIGVTGTRGKSTTTQMIYEAVKASNPNVILAGNVPGVSTISLLSSVQSTDTVILELSSWQLSGFHRKKVSPHIAVFTNMYPDHLNYYKTMEDYTYDKKAIYLYQKPHDVLIANKSLEATVKDAPHKNVQFFTANDFNEGFESLHGNHNKENAAAALLVAETLGLDKRKTISVLKSFKGVPFRQERVRTIGKVEFINDTTSTTPIATVKAIDAFNDKALVIIFGGNSKGLPTDEVFSSLRQAKRIVLLKGTMTDELLPVLQQKYSDKISVVYDDLEKAVADAFESAKTYQEGAYVLLSPGATSFAMFKNEFHRGEEFTRIVMNVQA